MSNLVEDLFPEAPKKKEIPPSALAALQAHRKRTMDIVQLHEYIQKYYPQVIPRYRKKMLQFLQIHPEGF